jgi:hypothetical protein
VTTMIGKKMALASLDKIATEECMCLPKTEEEETEENRQDAHADCLGLLEDLDNAVHERSNPQEPLQERCKHDSADNSDIDNLVRSVWVASTLV